jgi:hypothetical protein
MKGNIFGRWRRLVRKRNEFFAALLIAFVCVSCMVRLLVNSLEWETVNFLG